MPQKDFDTRKEQAKGGTLRSDYTWRNKRNSTKNKNIEPCISKRGENINDHL